MSLYYDTVSVLTAPSHTGGSFKSRIYNSKTLKSSPAQVFALVTEASKWDVLLKEVIENAGILALEHKLTPLLALLLVHDHLLSKRGIAAPANYPLRQAVERHKARLKAELTKARVRRACASLTDLQAAILREKEAIYGPDSVPEAMHPRWVRVNSVQTTLKSQLQSTFKSYQRVLSLTDLTAGKPQLYIDVNVPDLIAVSPRSDISLSPAYKKGEIILQDKASCFPAYLLLGDRDTEWTGDLIDGCAAPGNKTTHMASLLSATEFATADRQPMIYSMDVSTSRSKTLQKMVSLAGADKVVTVLAGQDFLALDPSDTRFERVSGLLLDPSCSGSGIVGRDDVPQLALPTGRGNSRTSGKPDARGKKRKRQHDDDKPEPDAPSADVMGATTATPTQWAAHPDREERLSKLANLQTHIVEHALGFSAAQRVTYSTCSVHMLENESVVSRVLASDVAKRRGWRIMRRDEQPEGLKKWKHRGIRTDPASPAGDRASAAVAVTVAVDLSDEELDACLRCWPGDDEGTGGFFVAGFIRDESAGADVDPPKQTPGGSGDSGENDEDDEEWEGFTD